MNKKEILDSIFYPRKSYKEQDLKDLLIPVSEDVSVGARVFLDNKNFPNILFFHGNAELAQEYDDIANFYKNYNCNLIVSDYRGYGLSSGISEKDNLLSDSVKIFDYIENFLSAEGFDGPVIVMGRSLGSASAWEIASKRLKNIGAVIIESGFATEYPLLDLMGITPSSIGFSLNDGFGNLEKIKKYKKPLLIIHAEEDHIVPFSEGELAYKTALSENKKIVVVESANHNNIIYRLGDRYFKDIEDFINSI